MGDQSIKRIIGKVELEMIAVRIPKEIREYREKLIFGLGARQLIALILMVGIGGATLYYGLPIVGADAVENIIFVECVPIGVIGFFPQKDGLKPEKYLSLIFRFYVRAPRKRKFISDNFFDFRNEKED